MKPSTCLRSTLPRWARPNRLLALLRESESNLFATRFNAAELSKETGITYDEVQLQAIGEALRSKVMVLTGGPAQARPLRPKVSSPH